jgi:hypothetical protein
MVGDCQAAGIFNSRKQPEGLLAVNAWSLIHGLVSLVIEGQVPSRIRQSVPPKRMVISALQQMVRVPVDENMIDIG